ncbi:MAG: hydrolase [Maritimibacter sp.]|nr:hydrolase [Maritimibacter sp.]
MGEDGSVTDRTILCFGDSNTHGTRALRFLNDRRRHAKADRWPSVMAGALGAGWDVIAEGHPGRTAVFDDPIEGVHKNGMRALPALLETHLPVDLVIVMLGTNDTKTRFSATSFDIAKGLEKVARTILASDAGPDGAAPRVLLAAPVPVIEVGPIAPMFVGAQTKSTELAGHLEAAASRLGVGFIDLAPVAQADPVDGVHLTADAQAAIGRAMADAVQQIFS